MISIWSHIRSKSRSALFTISGALLCAVCAAIVSAVFARSPGRAAMPILFVALIGLISAYFGVAAGIFGTVLSAVLFARWFYPPLGSLEVRDATARSQLAWMVLGGVSVSYLVGRDQEHRD